MMLQRNPELTNGELPIISICIISNKDRSPPNFSPILKSFDDGTEADLWKESFGFGIFNRTFRYLAVSRIVPDNRSHEVITDLVIISEKESVPINFVSIDYTSDTKERALRKKYLCVRFTPRNDATDALTEIIVLNRSKIPPKNYTSAGEIDGSLICFKVKNIPKVYGIKQHNIATVPYHPVYPSFNTSVHSQSDTSTLTLKSSFGVHPGLDGVPFKLNPRFITKFSSNSAMNFPRDPLPTINLDNFNYNFRLERSILSQK